MRTAPVTDGDGGAPETVFIIESPVVADRAGTSPDGFGPTTGPVPQQEKAVDR